MKKLMLGLLTTAAFLRDTLRDLDHGHRSLLIALAYYSCRRKFMRKANSLLKTHACLRFAALDPSVR